MTEARASITGATGENVLVWTFLRKFSGPHTLTVGQMCEYMATKGWGSEYCPFELWDHPCLLSAALAEQWIRYLFGIEEPKMVQVATVFQPETGGDWPVMLNDASHQQWIESGTQRYRLFGAPQAPLEPLEAAESGKDRGPAPRFYLATFHHGTVNGCVSWEAPGHAGYTPDLETAGRFDIEDAMDSEEAHIVAVPVAYLEELRVRRTVDTGDSKNASMRSAVALRAALAEQFEPRMQGLANRKGNL